MEAAKAKVDRADELTRLAAQLEYEKEKALYDQ